MAWGASSDAIGLGAFRPWDAPKADRGEWNPYGDAGSSSMTPPPSVLESDPGLDFPDPPTSTQRRGREAIGRVLRQQPAQIARHQAGSHRPSPSLGERAVGSRPPKVVEVQRDSSGIEKLRKLLRDCCTALRRPSGEAEKWAARLRAEWLESPEQLRSLGAEGWARLALPVGLESELQQRLRGTPKMASAARQRPKSAEPLRSSVRPGAMKRADQTPSQPRRPSFAPRDRDSGSLQGALRARCGASWASHLLSALGLQRQNAVDANSLQSALRSLGVARTSSSQLQAVVRSAAEGSEGQGAPSAEAVVAAIHGPLRGSRAEAVDAVFLDLGGARGALPSSALRRQFAPLELPAVKAGRMSADEALRNLTRAWRGLQAVSREDFAAVHVFLSAMYKGEDGFEQLVRRLWRLPAVPKAASGNSQEAGQEPFLVTAQSPRAADGSYSQVQAADAVCSGCGALLESDAQFCRFCGLKRKQPSLHSSPVRSREAAWPASPQRPAAGQPSFGRRSFDKDRRRENLGEFDRIAAIEDSIQRSDRAPDLLERLRAALRVRGSMAFEGLARRFRLADRRGRGRISAKELLQALREVGVGASEVDVIDLLRGMDVDGSGAVDLEEWLRVLQGPLSPARAAVVREAFEKLDRNGDGYVDVAELQARFIPSKHPDVEAKRKTADEVMLEFMSKLGDANRDGRLSLAEFLRYYEGISAGIQNDSYFASVIRRAWGLHTSVSEDCAWNAKRMYDGQIRTTEGGLSG